MNKPHAVSQSEPRDVLDQLPMPPITSQPTPVDELDVMNIDNLIEEVEEEEKKDS